MACGPGGRSHFEVIVPPTQDRIDLADDLLQAQVIAPSDLHADLLFQGLHRLATRQR